MNKESQEQQILSASCKHGHAYKNRVTVEWKAWQSMKQRCYNSNREDFSRYGARGITVCKRWRGPDGFINFLADMGRRPSSEYSIERTNNSKGYSPNNCKWATRIEQANNKRNNELLTLENVTLTIPQWSQCRGLNRSTIRTRLKLGWSPERALTTPAGPVGSNQFTYSIPAGQLRLI